MSATAQEARTLWRTLNTHFRVITAPLDAFVHPSSYRLMGADLLPGLLDGKRPREIVRVLSGATPEVLDALAAMARLNVERTGDAFKAVAVCYVTIPLALAALLSDAAPDQVRRFLEHAGSDILIILAWLLLAPAVYFISHWRAKQIAWSIELYRCGALAT